MSKKIIKNRLWLDRMLNAPLHWQLALVAGLFFLVLLGGWGGIAWLYGNAEIVLGEEALTPFWLTLLTMLNPSQISVSAYSGEASLFVLLALLAFLGLALLGGLFLSSFVGVRDERARLAREGKKRYHLRGGHALILGWNKTAPGIVKHLRPEGGSEPMIVILSSAEAENVRLDLAKANADKRGNIVVYHGNRADMDELECLEFEKVSRVCIVGETDSSSSDSGTLQTVVNLLRTTKDLADGRSFPCSLYIDDPYTCTLLRKVDFFDRDEREHVDIRLCNFYEGWAKRLWSSFPGCAKEFPALAQDPERCAKGDGVHLLIAGFGRMGQALAIEAARICHYANGAKTKITVIDKDLADLKESFVSRFFVERQGEGRFHDVEFVFVESCVESEASRRLLADAALDPRYVPTFAICFSSMDASLTAALSLPLEVGLSGATILVRQQGHSGLEALAKRLSESENTERMRLWRNFRFFGGLDERLHDDETEEKLAMMLNAVYRIIEDNSSEAELDAHIRSSGPGSLFTGLDELFWNSQEAKFRWSSRYQARAFPERLRSLGFTLKKCEAPASGRKPFFQIVPDVSAAEQIQRVKEALAAAEQNGLLFLDGVNVERLSEAEHDRWWAERVLAGWEYAEQTDKKRLKHCDMVKYADLDEAAKQKDRRSILLAPWLLREFAGVEIKPGSGEIETKE